MTFKKVPVNIVDDYSTSTWDIIDETKEYNKADEFEKEQIFFDKTTDRIVFFIIWLAIFLLAFFVGRFTTHNPTIDEQRSYILNSNGNLLQSLLKQEKILEIQMYELDSRIIKIQKCIELNNSSWSLDINNCEIWIN
jgi:hypothetical protein